jgi:hypothetical protein
MRILMKAVMLQFMLDIQKNQYTAGDANGKPEDIDGRVGLVPP